VEHYLFIMVAAVIALMEVEVKLGATPAAFPLPIFAATSPSRVIFFMASPLGLHDIKTIYGRV
jgi:hypothetical protein